MSCINPHEIADTYCNTKIKSRKCSFLWTIDQYPLFVGKNASLKSPVFSAVGDDFKWQLEYSEPSWSVGFEATYLTLHSPCDDDIRKCGTLPVDLEISTMKPDNTKLITKKSSFLVSFVSRSCCFWPFASLGEMMQCTFEDKLIILCQINYFKETDIVHLASSTELHSDKISECSLSTDMGKFFIDDYFSDVTISVKDKNYRVHKCILAVRSTVFNTMFRNNMQESQNNQIIITDVEQEIFEEMLLYIYTGKTRNLQESAFELLPVADKYDLKGLRYMCEEVLFEKISADNAVKILMLADMHHAEELKERTLRFIKENYAKCEDFKNSDVWKILSTSHLQLMKDMMAAFCEN